MPASPRLLAVAYENGGGLLKFGGDALVLLFEGSHHEVAACRAAVAMRRTLRETGRFDVSGFPVTLRMSIGVHSGDFHFFLVGDSHRELVITGPAATRTVEMEGTADAGEIVISDATAAALRPSLLGAPKGPGRLLKRVPADATDRAASPAPCRSRSTSTCRAASPSRCATRCSPTCASPSTAASRSRSSTSTASTTCSWPLGPQELARRLQELVATVQRAVDRRGVTFLATDIDRDGGKVILTAGAPIASADDERRMLLALRATSSRLRWSCPCASA